MLITLVIIGVVAALTIPTLMKKYQTHIFKTAYKQAYSDISQAFSQAFKDDELIRTTKFQVDATTQEWNILKQNLKVSKECAKSDLYSCWAQGDTIWGGYPNSNSSQGFIDAAGRTWTTYTSTENLFIVDTNGFKGPNKFGQDRFIFTICGKHRTNQISNNNDNRTNDYSTNPPVKIMPAYKNFTEKSELFCNYPPCYYYDWLYK